MITLDLCKIGVSWGKNEYSPYHGALFLASERRLLCPNDGVEQTVGPALAATLRDVVPRLELLGWTLPACAAVWDRELDASDDDESDMSFGTLVDLLGAIDARLPVPTFESGPECSHSSAARAVLESAAFMALTEDARCRAMDAIDRLAPEMLLRLLAENPRNCGVDVIWSYADHVDAGWSREESHFAGPRSGQVFMIVTEGSSDTYILQEALARVAPGVVRFFRFIDMKDNYPFGGAGDLVRFVKGLAKIQHDKFVVALFDNDCAGRVHMQQALSASLPKNIAVMTLPDLESARSFSTVGPSGEFDADVNGRAVSIEMFLDLNAVRNNSSCGPRVRWKAFDPGAGEYQGELERKKEFSDYFLKTSPLPASYDLSGLRLVWDAIIERCVAMAEARTIERAR